MSVMGAEIGRIVDEDISPRVTQYDVLNEAIINAIQANASNITCLLNAVEKPLKDEGVEIVKRKIDTISVTDDGEGFNDDNYKSFCMFRTDLHKDLGCKGVGRLVYLKIFREVNFESQLVKEQEVRKFRFDRHFNPDTLRKEHATVNSNSTKITLSQLTPQYRNPEREVDRRIEINLDIIREKVLLNLIPTLFFFKKKGRDIRIDLIDEQTSEKRSILTSNVPSFSERPFQIKTKDEQAYDFTLNYWIENTAGKLHAYYCAANRTVCEFSDKDFSLSLPAGYSGFFLLESEYLQSRVNNERNDFDIFPVRTDFASPISWDTINTRLKGEIAEIVKVGIPETEQINKTKLEKIQANRPYLTPYIDENDIEMAGFVDEKQIIEKAKKRFDRAKESVLATAGKEEYTDSELRQAIELAQNELVSYIHDRAQVLERLRSLVDKKERVEDIIHNLFMEKRTDDDFFCIGKNNLWLIDDRFTTYSYAASDKRIKEVLANIGESEDSVDNLDDRPDLSLFFSHNPDEPNRLKSVMIEIKPFDFSSKPDRKKFAGIQQAIDYVTAFKDKEKIEEIFGFVITDIDKKLEERLRLDDYIPLFSTSSPIFYRHYGQGISIYFISANTLIADAEARNRVFLDIIRKQSRIYKILQSNVEDVQDSS